MAEHLAATTAVTDQPVTLSLENYNLLVRLVHRANAQPDATTPTASSIGWTKGDLRVQGAAQAFLESVYAPESEP